MASSGSYPRKVGPFKKWASRMVDGATVDREASSKKRPQSSKRNPGRIRRKRRRTKRTKMAD